MMPLLELKEVQLTFGEIHVLQGVSFALAPGEMLALMGPNGAGKSSVLKTIFGRESLSAGTIRWRGEALTPTPTMMADQGIALVPQGRRVFGALSVRENLEMGIGEKLRRSERNQRLQEVLVLFPALLQKLDLPARTLSGGQQQMLAIARGLLTKPTLLLLDEPSLGLSPKATQELYDLLQRIHEEHHTAMIIVEHHLEVLAQHVERVLVLERGKVVATGTPQELREQQVFEHVFLGQR